MGIGFKGGRIGSVISTAPYREFPQQQPKFCYSFARWSETNINKCINGACLMSRLAKENILELSITERIQLVEDIWDSILIAPESIRLTEEQKMELDRRLDDYHNDPGKGAPWEIVRERIRSRKCRSK
jgi:putative addiction module component (TIGR02574 family)